jgi:hypothetical protein
VFVKDQARLFPSRGSICVAVGLDLMAQLAGLRLRHRWGNWSRGDFNGDSEKHVSVYEKTV